MVRWQWDTGSGELVIGHGDLVMGHGELVMEHWLWQCYGHAHW